MKIPAFAGYKIVSLVGPHIMQRFSGPGSAATPTSAHSSNGKENLSKRQQKLQARYEKGDKRYQAIQK